MKDCDSTLKISKKNMRKRKTKEEKEQRRFVGCLRDDETEGGEGGREGWWGLIETKKPEGKEKRS